MSGRPAMLRGPWRISPSDHRIIVLASTGDTVCAVADSSLGDAWTEAVERLIAEAPELLQRAVEAAGALQGLDTILRELSVARTADHLRDEILAPLLKTIERITG